MACSHALRIPTSSSVSGPFVSLGGSFKLIISANLLVATVLSIPVPISVPVSNSIPANLSSVFASQEEIIRHGAKVLTHRGANYPTVKKDMSALLFPKDEEHHRDHDSGESSRWSILFPEQGWPWP